IINNSSRLSDNGLQCLGHLAYLMKLSLHGIVVPLSDMGFACISKLPNLAELLIMDCGQITDRGFQIFCSRPRLVKLCLRNCVHLTDATLSRLPILSQLEYLLLWNTRTSERARSQLVRAMPQLHYCSIT